MENKNKEFKQAVREYVTQVSSVNNGIKGKCLTFEEASKLSRAQKDLINIYESLKIESKTLDFFELAPEHLLTTSLAIFHVFVDLHYFDSLDAYYKYHETLVTAYKDIYLKELDGK